MAKFLNTSAINYFLEELIKTTSERLILIPGIKRRKILPDAERSERRR